MSRFLKSGACLLALTLPACSFSGSVDAAAQGELGNGEFRYYCTGANDPVCNDGLSPSTFPTCIIAGGNFELRFDAADHQFHDIRVESVSSLYFTGARDSFSADAPGRAALVAYSEDRVIDMVHFDIVLPTDIGIWQKDGTALPDPLPVEVQEKVEIDVFGGATCGALGGSTAVEVHSSDESVLTAVWEFDGLELRGRGEGEATVTVTMSGLERSFDVLVAPGPDEPGPPTRIPPEPTSTSGDSDTDSDSDTDTDTDTDSDTDTDTDGGEADTDTDTDGTTGG